MPCRGSGPRSTARSGSCSPATGGSGRGGKRGPHPSRPAILDCGSNSRVGSRPAAGPLLFQESDLLVVPSIWPEPFGQVGPEAGLYGVPVAAFAVGGTPSWLTDGVNGLLAAGDPPTAAGLAESIVGCLADPADPPAPPDRCLAACRPVHVGQPLFAADGRAHPGSPGEGLTRLRLRENV